MTLSLLLLTSGERVVLLCALTVALYASPLLQHTFDQWQFLFLYDDHKNFIANPVLQDDDFLFSWENLVRMATMRRVNVYEPLSWLLKAFIVQSVGLNSWAIRVVTGVLHFAAGWVLVKVSVLLIEINNLLAEVTLIRSKATKPGIRLLSTSGEEGHHRSDNPYFLGCSLSALLYLVHPVHVEVVAWPSAQPYALTAIFANLSLLFYTQKVRSRLQSAVSPANLSSLKTADIIFADFSLISGGSDKGDLLSLAFYLCGVLSKSVCVLLPVGFLLLDAFVIFKLQPTDSRQFLHRFAQCVMQKAPVLLVLLAFAGIALWSNEEGSKIDTDVLSLTLSERVLKTLITPMWVVRQLAWPTRLRVHFQLHEDDLDLFGSPENLLSVAALILCVVTGVWRTKERQSPELLLALLYFCVMLLPTSGLIQHGIVTSGCPRYAYFPSMVFVPFGGFALGNVLFSGATPAQQAGQRVEQGASAKRIVRVSIKPGNAAAVSRLNSPPSKRQPAASRAAERLRHRVVVAYLGPLCASVLISTRQLETWRNEALLYQQSLRLDPSDWRMYEWSALASTATPLGCSMGNPKCRSLWELSWVFAPRKTLKASLFRVKILFALDQRDHACALSLELLKEYSYSAHVLNNAGICSLRSGKLNNAREFFVQAAHTPGYEAYRMTPLQNLQSFDGSMAAFHAEHGERASMAEEIDGVIAAIMW